MVPYYVFGVLFVFGGPTAEVVNPRECAGLIEHFSRAKKKS